MGMYSTNSMLPIVLNAKYGLDAVQVGYTLTVIALMRLVAGIWIAIPAQRRFGMGLAAGLGALCAGLFLVLAACVENMWLCIAALAISRMGSSVCTSATGALSGTISSPQNRGRVFSLIQSLQNMGMLVGPIVAGNLAEVDPTFAPLVFSGVSLVVSAILHICIAEPPRAVGGPSGLETSTPRLEEEGSPEDYEALGAFVGELMKRRRYRWVSRKREVYAMLDKLLPELSAEGDCHLAEMERIVAHAEAFSSRDEDCARSQ